MKKLFLVLVAALFVISGFTQTASAKELKIGYVDMQKVFTEYKKTKEAETKLESEGKTKTDERNKMVEAVRRLKDEIELLSDKGKEEKQAQIDKKIKELQDFDIRTRNEIMQEREDVIRQISKDIDKAISDYAAKNKFDMILNKDKRVLLFDTGELDVTAEILKVLNK